MVQVTASGNLMLWGIIPMCTLQLLVPAGHCLNPTAYLSIVANNVHLFMATVKSSINGYFQQDNVQCDAAQIISKWFLEHNNELIAFTLSSTDTRSNPTGHFWDVLEWQIAS